MKFKNYWLFTFFITLLLACSNDDDLYDFNIEFYSNVDKSITKSDVKGKWAIIGLEFKNEYVPVPINYEECGRDYLFFKENDIYKEYLYQSSNCSYISSTYNWTLIEGIITLKNQLNETEELAVTELTDNVFNFKTKIDVDNDGELDIVKAFLKPYTPIEVDLVSDTFNRNQSEEFKNLISYNWQKYEGAQEFVAYEIYRNKGLNCSKNNAELIATITNPDITIFTDLTPPKEENICYFLRVLVKDKLLGESELHSLQTYTLEATPVNFNKPNVNKNTLQLSWEKSTMPYFSHYEISYSNFPPNITGYGEQNFNVANISDINIVNFVVENIPHYEKPFYKINVVDIFGNKTYDYNDNYVTFQELDYKRDEILELNRISSFVKSTHSPIIYLLGYNTKDFNPLKIYKYNYESNDIEKTSSKTIDTSTEISPKIINSSYGEEILIEQADDIEVFDANTLDFKYKLTTKNYVNIDDFLFSSTGYLIIVDSNYIFSYLRNENNLILIDKKPHFSIYQSSYNYTMIELVNNQLLVGHKNESTSILYNIDSNGVLSQEKSVAVAIAENGKMNTRYNSSANLIINFAEKQVFSTINFSSLESFSQPKFATDISKEGNYIFGTNNDPSWDISDESEQQKEVILYNRQTKEIQTVISKGYPHVIFEDYNGKIISISSGMKRENLFRNITDKGDLFIEIIK